MVIPASVKPLQDQSDAEFSATVARTRHDNRKAKKRTTAKIETFKTISAEPITWLWPDRIARGKLVIFAGDPGLGKSQGSLDVAARLSTGFPFPDGTKPPEIGDTLILTSEDDPGDTIRPRLDALGADLERIHFLRCKVEGDGKMEYPSILDLEVFRDAADQMVAGGGRLRLLIIDPIEGFLAGADAHKNAEVRSVLGPLVALASELGFSILGIQHLNKGNGSAAYRVGGSIAFTALARSVWIFAKDREDPDRRLFLCLKNNLGRDQAGLEYRIEQAENGSPFIRWIGIVDDDVRDILSSDHAKREPRDKIAPEQDRVLEFMQTKASAPVQRKDIAAKLETTPSAVAKILDKLRAQGLVRPSGIYGYWELSSPSMPMGTDHSRDSKDSIKELSSESPLSSVPSSVRTRDSPHADLEFDIY